MSQSDSSGRTRFRVVDALDHPHGHRILRTRIVDGPAPSVRRLRGAQLHGTGPDGNERNARVLGFPVFGGSPSDDRIRDTGRVDLIVDSEGSDEEPEITLSWELSLEDR